MLSFTGLQVPGDTQKRDSIGLRICDFRPITELWRMQEVKNCSEEVVIGGAIVALALHREQLMNGNGKKSLKNKNKRKAENTNIKDVIGEEQEKN